MSQEFELLKKSAITEISSDLENQVQLQLSQWEVDKALTESGDFDTGFTATERHQIFLYNGEWYRWDGKLPKSVPPSSTPASTGGVVVGAWRSVGDAALRQDLADPARGSKIVRYDEKNTVYDAINRNRKDFWANKETMGGTYTHYVREDDGTPVAGAECAVYVGKSGVLATGLKDKFGEPLANPFVTGANGLVQFVADPGMYTLQVSFDLVVHTYSVYFADEQVRADLANPDLGAAMVAFKRHGLSDAVARTLYDRGRDVWLVRDFTSVQAAIDALPNGGTLYFSGEHDWSTEVSLAGKSNITLISDGATLRQTGNRFRSFFDCSGSTGTITFRGFRFDQRGSEMPLYTAEDYPAIYNAAIYGSGVEDIYVERCQFIDLYTRAIHLHNTSSLTVLESDFRSGVQMQDQQLDHVGVTTAGRVTVQGCSFINAAPWTPDRGPCGIVVSGIRNSVNIDRNYFNYCGRNNAGAHRLGAIDVYYDAENVTISNNVAENCMAQFLRLSACNGGLVSGNKVTLSGSSESGGTILSVEGWFSVGAPNNGSKNISVINNVFSDPFNRCEVGVGVYAYDWGLPSDQVEVANNQFTGVKFAVAVMGPYRKLTIRDNVARGYLGAISVRPTVMGQDMTSNFGLESSCILDSLTISGNKISNEADLIASAVLFDSEKTPAFSGQIRELTISGNHLTALSAKATPAVFIRASAANKPDTHVSGNFTRQYQNAVSVSNTSVTRVTGNTAREITGDFIVDAGGNDVVHRRSNSDGGIFAGGPTQGRATLVAGLVVVNTVEVTTGATIAVSRILTGGSPGHLSVRSITNRTSFTIQSSSTSDVSTVFWEIIK